VFQVEARWVMRPGNREKVKAALVDYVKAVKDKEPDTYMYTVSFADASPDSLAIPPMQLDQVTYNSAWKTTTGSSRIPRNRCIRTSSRNTATCSCRPSPARRCIRT